MWLVKFTVMFLALANQAAAGHVYYKKGQIGEYYDYDVEGSPRRRVVHEHAHHLSRALKKPIKVLAKAGTYGYQGIKLGRATLENYLKGTAHDARQQQKLAHALTDWETALTANAEHQKPQSAPGLLYAPNEAWRLFKYSLYLAGFALPRSLKRGAKDIIVNTFGGEEGK